jgi:hypothetical protein
MLVMLFAAHQGEELALVLPAIMLVGAFFIFRWANQKPQDDEDASGNGGEIDQVDGHVERGVDDARDDDRVGGAHQVAR